MSQQQWWQGACRQPDSAAEAAARARQAQLTKPAGALGQLEAIAIQLAGLQGREQPQIERPWLSLFAGDHGVVAEVEAVNVAPESAEVFVLDERGPALESPVLEGVEDLVEGEGRL